ncbi:putative glycolipid-binding domain-containing protein [Xanthomonas translucens pv. undulosa]|nr:putative glycolipid-binding domain-containing protein [Xanthomonas translucens pv. undulosa]
MHTVASILWRRLDAPGHDACRLQRNASAWQLDGAAVFRLEHGRIGQLQYRVQCDLHWHTQRGTVRGWLGGGTVDLAIARDVRGHWKLNGRPVADVSHCIDLDLGFTPATNLLQLRRLRLAVGEGADAPAAWVDLDGGGTLSELMQRYARTADDAYAYQAKRFGYAAVQRYARTADDAYAYQAKRFGYAATLCATGEGFVRDYPGLWTAEA